MKRTGNLYKEICDPTNLELAHRHARKGKGWYAEVMKVNNDLDRYLDELRESMISQSYETSEYQVFSRKEGTKVRDICKLPYYPDRIAQWAIMQVIEPYLIRNLISDTYSAIAGRGSHKAIDKLQKCLKSDVEGTQYCLKLDVKKFYANIDHDTLKGIYSKLFKDKELLWIIGEIIDSTEGDVGIPIGNYISQWSGNIYLSSFDHWLKEVKGIKHYFRYMDDMIILGSSKEELHKLRLEIEEYLSQNLKLHLKDNWQVFPVDSDRGIDFIGYRVFRDYTLLRKSIAKNFKKKMLEIAQKIEDGREINFHDYCSAYSYKGWLMHCNCHNLLTRYLDPIQPYLDEYYRKEIKPHERKKNRSERTVSSQTFSDSNY